MDNISEEKKEITEDMYPFDIDSLDDGLRNIIDAVFNEFGSLASMELGKKLNNIFPAIPMGGIVDSTVLHKLLNNQNLSNEDIVVFVNNYHQ